jgi:hypothetical protein
MMAGSRLCKTVVEHYNGLHHLALSGSEKAALVEYLNSLSPKSKTEDLQNGSCSWTIGQRFGEIQTKQR